MDGDDPNDPVPGPTPDLNDPNDPTTTSTTTTVAPNGDVVTTIANSLLKNVSEVLCSPGKRIVYSEGLFCPVWEDPNSLLFAIGNLFILISLIPLFTRPSHQWHLFERLFLTAGCFALSIWAWTEHCAPDITVWNLIFGVMHGYYVIELMMGLRTKRYFPPDQENIRQALFPTAPLHAFERLMDLSTTENFDHGSTLVIHGKQDLRLVVAGKVQATSGNRVLYHARFKQFADSVNRLGHMTEAVLLSFVRSTRLMVWDSDALHQINEDTELKSLLNPVVSTDAAGKLRTFLHSISKPVAETPTPASSST